MRKPRDYDADLKVLADKARQLKTRKQSQLGELVMATGADALGVEELAGALLHAAGTDAATREAWRSFLSARTARRWPPRWSRAGRHCGGRPWRGTGSRRNGRGMITATGR